LLLVNIALLGSVAGCGDPSGSDQPVPAVTQPPPTTATPAPMTYAPPTTPARTTPVSTGSPPTPASGSPVALDPTLLSILPDAVAGARVAPEPDSFAAAMSDASFVANVDAAAFAVVVDANDLASGVVAHLRAGVFSDAFFRDWRDSYDDGACAQAGGVAAHLETGIAGRTVYVTTCSGGLRTYHAHVPERGVIVSLFSVGERRFGEQLMAGLRP
jgi:hypothetical protein